METSLECPVCLDIFGSNLSHIKVPKVLQCGHSVCRECLENLNENAENNFFSCPICNKQIIKGDNLDDFTTNITLINIINHNFNTSNIEDDNHNDNAIKYNIILLGSSAVGKTCILQRLSNNIFSENQQASIGVNKTIYKVKYKNQKYQLNVNDPAGQEKYKSITKSFLRNTDGVIFVFDMSDEKSFNDLEFWLNTYKEVNKKVIGLLIGNKCDLKHVVDEEKANEFAEEHGLKYLETSAKLDKNLKKAIVCILEKIIQSKKTEIEKKTNDIIDLGESKSSVSSYLTISEKDNQSSIKINKIVKKSKKCCQ